VLWPRGPGARALRYAAEKFDIEKIADRLKAIRSGACKEQEKYRESGCKRGLFLRMCALSAGL
jgi:hypothetical protein